MLAEVHELQRNAVHVVINAEYVRQLGSVRMGFSTRRHLIAAHKAKFELIDDKRAEGLLSFVGERVIDADVRRIPS
jgi:hypothetical protein